MTTVALGCTSDFFKNTNCIIPRSDTEKCPLVFGIFAIAVMVMAYNPTHKEFSNSEQLNAFYYSSLKLQAQSTLCYLDLQTLALPAVVIVHPPNCHRHSSWSLSLEENMFLPVESWEYKSFSLVLHICLVLAWCLSLYYSDTKKLSI